ncbi:uncharacterized protein ccdc175 [Anableps anableps]
MASCLVPEFPAVQVALERLKELERQFIAEGVSFSAEGSIHLTAIAEAVSELEAIRRTTHEELEVETIESSKLRYHIKNMSDRMSEDILADRAAARASNAKEIEQLRRELSLSSQIQEESEDKLQELLDKNKLLQEERDWMRHTHERLIPSLNNQISLKYERQQHLDQTLEQIKELKSSIIACEEEKAALLERMALERKAFSEEKEILNIQVAETISKIRQQKKLTSKTKQELDKINEKKKELDDHQSKLNDQMAQLESRLEIWKSSHSYCEHQLQELFKQSQELNQQIEAQKKENQDLEDAFRLAVKNLQKEIRQVEEKLLAAQATGKLLRDNLVLICKVFRHKQEVEKEAQAYHRQVSLQLERSKEQLEERIASIVKHKKDIREMERQILELQEDDIINRRIFASKREESLSDLSAVESKIAQFQGELEELSAFLEEAKIRQEEYKMKMMSNICNTRKRYEELLLEEAALLQQYPESGHADSLLKLMAQLEKEHSQIQSLRQEERQQIIKETEEICRSNEEKQKELEEQEKILEEVEAEWSKVKNRYEKLSALKRVLNWRRSKLEWSIESTEEHTRMLLQPRQDMKADLEKLQELYSNMLSKQNTELIAVEVTIYKQNMLLEQFRAENSRLHLCVRKVTEDISTCRQETEQYQQEVQEFNRKVEALLKDLQEAWKRDISVVEDSKKSDDQLLVLMSSELVQLETRNQQLTSIGTLLHQLMLEFSKRLGDKAI